MTQVGAFAVKIDETEAHGNGGIHGFDSTVSVAEC